MTTEQTVSTPHDLSTPLRGLWLPLITPFADGQLDAVSLRRLVRHYAGLPVDGLILGATTGEGLTLDEDEAADIATIVDAAMAEGARRMPVLLGLAGADTRKVQRMVERTAAWPVDGYLISSPYYLRPSQEGLFRHFAAVAGATGRPIALYNIPYRTGVSLTNDTMRRLAAHCPNIVGLKDCSADAAQSAELLRDRPPGFAVLTGEDAGIYQALVHGADGAIAASAHVATARFAEVAALLAAGDQPAALAAWNRLADLPRLLFAEPSPAPIKHWLHRAGLIASPEVRLPMAPVSDELAMRLDRAMDRWS